MPFKTRLEQAYLICKCLLVLSIAFACVYTPVVVRSELQSARKDVILEVQATRTDAKDLVNTRFDSLQNSVGGWLKVADRRLASLEKTTDNRLGSIEKNTFTLASDLRTDVFKRVDKIEGDLNTQLTTTNSHVGEVTKAWAIVPSTVGARLDKQTDCATNKLCFQNLFADTMIDVRYTARDVSTASQTFGAAVPVWTKNTTDITTSFANTSKNIDRLTTPKWYDRVLGYALNGAILYRQFNPATNVVTTVVQATSGRP